MSFSREWDERYQANTHMGIWPWSDLVSYVMRYAKPGAPGFRVLELGCGPGANIPFFLSLGVEYLAIEGSETAVAGLWERFPQIKEQIMVGDFTEEIRVAGEVDLIVDRAALTHNTAAAIKRSLALIYEKLTPGGKFIGIDWFSTRHAEYRRGVAAEDAFTRTGYQTGPFAQVGRVHYSTKEHLQELLQPLVIQVLEHKVITREIPAAQSEEKYELATWNLVAEKL